MSDSDLTRLGFLNLVGLNHPASANGKPRSVQLAEAGVDPRTGGAVAVTTDAMLDGNDGVTHIKTHYWRMLPSGEQVSQELFDIEFEQGESIALTTGGSPVKKPIMIPRAVYVLGRHKVYDAAGEDERDGGGADMRNISRVLAAVGKVNRQMREGKLPEVAKILKECAVHQAVGEDLKITGLSPEGGFEFDAVDASRVKVGDKLTVPTIVAQALMGFDINTLDKDHKLRSKNPVQATDSRNGTVFLCEANVRKGDNPQASTAITPTSQGSSPAQAIPCLTNVVWKSDGEDQVTLKDLNLLGENMVGGKDHLTRMRALGITNRILHDVRRSEYPPSMDHLVEHDLYDLVYHFEQPPPLREGGRLTMISVGGNNMEEIAEGFGEAIGGNSKVVYHEGLDRDGKVSRVGVIVDFGLHLSPKDEVNVSAAPDVVEHLRNCKDILITHRHLDHTDGLFAYIQAGLLRHHTVHATPEVIKALRNKLRTYPGIHRDDLPTFSEIEGEGWLHVRDEEGKARLSVNYARNATPHSARDTPFIVHGHYEGKWVGSYLNHGDARYGRHNGDDYVGPPVDADHLNKEYFNQSNRHFLEEMKRLDPEIAKRFDPKIADRGPTYFDMDTTSILRQGWAPTEAEVEENLVKVFSWFEDKGVLLSMISTNDNRFETALRVATQSHRDLTEFGTNLQQTATTFNTGGVNDLRQKPIKRNNIQHYLDWYYEARLQEKIDKHKDNLSDKHEQEIKKNIGELETTLESAGDGDKRGIEEKINEFKARLQEKHKIEKKIGELEAKLQEKHEIEENIKELRAITKLKSTSNEEKREIGENIKELEAKLKSKSDEEWRGIGENIKGLEAKLHEKHGQLIEEKIEALNAKLASAGDEEKRGIRKNIKALETELQEIHEIQGKIERNEARLTAFQTLKGMKNQYKRYLARKELEKDLQERFGRDATLGSIEASDDPEEKGLGSVRVGRTTETSRHIMGGQDGRRLALLTGTQGTNVEIDAALSALAGGYGQLNGSTKNSHTARPVDPKDNIVVISQTAIPGNDGRQNELVRKLTSRGFTVVQAVHDGFQIHNIDGDRREKITKALEKLGKVAEEQVDGSLVVHGMPVHASGHGYQEDCRAWLNLVKADITAAQHTSDPQGGVRLFEMCDAAKRRHQGRVVPNFEGLSIKAGDRPESTEIRSIGRTLPSLILIEIVRQKRKYFGGHLKIRRVVNLASEGEFRSDGLLATVRKGGWYEHVFPSVDAEEAARRQASRKPDRSQVDPVKENRTPPKAEHPHRGPDNPGWRRLLSHPRTHGEHETTASVGR